MKKNLLAFLLIIQATILAAQSATIHKTAEAQSKTTDLWVNPEGMENNMTIYATVYKDNAVYEPAGLLLGVFKGTDSFCYGYDTWLEMTDKSKMHMVLAMSNEASGSGYSFKAYNPGTGELFDITETFSFVADGELGAFNNPAKLNISGLSSMSKTMEDKVMVYPNPVVDRFSVNVQSLASGKMKMDLLNANGQFVKHLYSGEAAGSRVFTFPKGELVAGIYFLKLTVGNKIRFNKLIVR